MIGECANEIQILLFEKKVEPWDMKQDCCPHLGFKTTAKWFSCVSHFECPFISGIYSENRVITTKMEKSQ